MIARFAATLVTTRAAATFVALCGALALAASATASAQTTPMTARDAWVREPAPNRKQTALFVTVENASAKARSIVSASSDAAETVELHEMIRDGAMMRMSPVKTIDVPANGKAELKPGGLHIMLFGLKRQPVDGDTIRVTLKFDNGSTVTVAAPVRKPEGMK
jgi:periplasmic copper chaperone A